MIKVKKVCEDHEWENPIVTYGLASTIKKMVGGITAETHDSSAACQFSETGLYCDNECGWR